MILLRDYSLQSKPESNFATFYLFIHTPQLLLSVTTTMQKVEPISTNPQQTELTKESKDSQHAAVQPSTVSEDYPRGWRLFLVILPLCLGTLLVAIDNTIIAVAVPKISSTFKALDQAAWYGSIYLLTVTAFQPTFGKLYKFFNVKFTYLVSVALFEGSISPNAQFSTFG